MENLLVSVVVPVYKTERYLDQCISSIVSQTYSNLEILLIDDGSPDRCPEICDTWAKSDSRIRVIHKQNAGLGKARNTGIEQAKGAYICFFDSDDYILPDTIEKVYRKAADETVDIVVFGFSTINDKGETVSVFEPDMEQPVYRNGQVQKDFLPELIAPDPCGDGKRRLYMSACMILYSMELIRRTGWRFASEREIISEDVYSLLELFRYVNGAAILSEALYVYRANLQSISRSYRPNRYAAIRHFYQESIALCTRLNYGPEILRRLADPFLAFTRAAMKQEMAAPILVTERIRHIRAILEDETLQTVLQDVGTDNTGTVRRLLFFAMKHKMTGLCCILLAVRNMADRWKKPAGRGNE